MQVIPVCNDVKGLINEYLMISKQDVEGLRKRNVHFLNMLFSYYKVEYLLLVDPERGFPIILSDLTRCINCHKYFHIRMTTLLDFNSVCFECEEILSDD